MRSPNTIAAIFALSSCSIAAASVSQTCPSHRHSDVCYSLSIPDSTANSGTGDIYFQISAPSSLQWVALGQGNKMAGSNIFVIYTSVGGQNLTISPRVGVGNVQPKYSSDAAQLTLLEGSGVSNGTMTANVRCSNCDSWSGGTMDFSGASGSWIYGAKSGSALNSNDLTQGISQHDFMGSFNWDFSAAKGGNDVNPFLISAVAPPQTTTPPPSTGDDSDASQPSNLNAVTIAHGALASTAFVILFPAGGILIRVAKFSGLVKTHVAIQVLGFLMWITAFGMGIWIALENGLTSNRHPIIGYIIFAILLFQPLYGWLHHRVFKRTGHRNIWSVAHLSVGRIAIILGMINGGLGLQLAANAHGALITYSVLAGVIGTAYIAAIIYGEMKRRSNKQGSLRPGQSLAENGLKSEGNASMVKEES